MPEKHELSMALKDLAEVAEKSARNSADLASAVERRLGEVKDGQVQRVQMYVVDLFRQAAATYAVLGTAIEGIAVIAGAVEEGTEGSKVEARVSQVEAELERIKATSKKWEAAARDSGMYG